MLARAPGLRLILLLALSAAFLLSFALLDLAAVKLAERSREATLQREAETTVRVLATALATAPVDEVRFEAIASEITSHRRYDRLVLRPFHGATIARGTVRAGRVAEAEVPGVGRLELHRAPVDRRERARFGEYLLLYVALTAAAIVLLTYVGLTVLIVRPVEMLTVASERLARGQVDASVPVSGSGEVARLGAAFNAMASQLRVDRAALETRVAELTATTAHLEHAKDQIVRAEKLASVGRLAAGLAHEIGNPLAAVLGLLELLRSGDLSTEEQVEFLDCAKRETERIHSILRDLLDYARGDAAAVDDAGEASLAEVVDESLALLAPQKNLRGVRVERRFEAGLPPVHGRAERLVQIVMNLLLNAADAVAGEGTIVLVLTREGDEVELRVEDSGPGIAPEVRTSLFEPFVTTKPAGRGTGLGLAVCHTIVERLGGSIRAENRDEGGARIVVRLPIANEAST